MSWLVYLLLVSLLAVTVWFSVRARRQTEGVLRQLLFARMNISIGLLFLVLSFAQMFLSPYSWWRVGFAIVVLLIGLYNLFVGLRNHGYYSRK